jgi:hypothetical protein
MALLEKMAATNSTAGGLKTAATNSRTNSKVGGSETRPYENKFKGNGRRRLVEQLFDFCFDFGLLEGLALDLAVTFGVH